MKTARAWRIKELWRTFKQCQDVDDAHAFFHKWYVLTMRPKLEPVKKVARTFKAHLAGIVSIFKHGFCNALAEDVNRRIQLLMQKSCGYRNRQRLKIDILFHLGGLNIFPLSAQCPPSQTRKRREVTTRLGSAAFPMQIGGTLGIVLILVAIVLLIRARSRPAPAVQQPIEA